MKRRLLSLLIGLGVTASAQQATTQPQMLKDIAAAQQQIIAYLPALKSQPVALSLKNAANRGIQVFLIAPPNAHLARDTYLLSVALAAAQTPPAPMSYHRATLNAAPFVIVDNRALYLGAGVQGIGSIFTGTPQQTAAGVQISIKTIKAAPATSPAQLVKEKYKLK